jgi:hypothetical protein
MMNNRDWSLLHVLSMKEPYCKNVWFLDEEHFNMAGIVNKHNVHFWAAENPHMFIKKVQPR